MKKNLLIICSLLLLTACDKKEVLPGQSQLDTGEPEMNDLDHWIMDNLTTPYNIDVRYRWDEWNLSDMGKYNYPTTPDHANVLMRILKHTWIDSYVQTAGENFIKHNSPRQFTLFGGVDLTPNGTAGAWGQAAGGLNILLFQVNNLNASDLTSTGSLGAYSYLIHHEFTHILNQNVPFDEENFQKITPEGYTAQFQLIPEEVSHQEGFISSYARMNIMEDFAEMVSNLVTRSPDQWEAFVNQEVDKFTKQRDDFINGIPSETEAREEMRTQLNSLKSIISEKTSILATYPDNFTAADEDLSLQYITEVFIPVITEIEPISDFLYSNYRDDLNAGDETSYRLLVKIDPILYDDNFAYSPGLLKKLIGIFSNEVIPYLETRFEGAINLNSLSEIFASLNTATRGRDKIKEKERFIADYFKNSLKVDLYELQANTYQKITTPINLPNAPGTSASMNKDIKMKLLNSRFHTCSWEKHAH